MTLVNVNCYNCHSNQYNYYDSENGFTLVKCLNCGLLYVNPQPNENDIEESVKTGQHKGAKVFSATGKFQYSKVKNYLNILNDFYSENIGTFSQYKWLDIGAGHGEFLSALKLFFGEDVNVLGSEPNIHKAKSAQARGVNVVPLNLNKHDYYYDCISLLNVYSHLPNPIQKLKEWTKLLKKNGEILIQTGDTSDLKSGNHPKPYYLPDHLSFASEKIITYILCKMDFEIIRIQKYRCASSPEVTPIRIIKELIKLMIPSQKSKFLYYFKKYPNLNMWIRAKRIY